jgi:hypothetical protein
LIVAPPFFFAISEYERSFFLAKSLTYEGTNVPSQEQVTSENENFDDGT